MVRPNSVFSEDGLLLMMIVSGRLERPGIEFFTPDDLQQQVAAMNRLTGETIAAHSHLPVPRSVQGTQEVLVILKGQLRVDVYDLEKRFVASEVAREGDIVILVDGGHGFEIIEDCEFIEVKQGPYVRGKDKVLFGSGEVR